MSNANPKEWLERWAASHINAPGHADKKSDMRDLASFCAKAAEASGISIHDLKEAAGGDLEVYLVRKQNSQDNNVASS